MQIPSIRNVVTFPVNYFLESSWQGKAVQVLGAISILALIYLVFRKKTSPQGPTAKGLNGRANQQTSTSNGSLSRSTSRAQPSGVSKEFPKADLSYIQQTRVHSDIEWPQSEFDIWLSYPKENFSNWCTLATSLSQVHEGFCRRELKNCISGLKEQAKKTIPIFEKYGVKEPDEDAFLHDCNEAEVGPKTNLVDFCDKLKGYLDRLQSWNTALHKLKKKQLMEKLKCCPHYEFTHLQTQYFHYLGLHSILTFARHLETKKIDYLEQFGLRTMEDVNCLQLTSMQPLIERLRQFVCFFEITRDKETVRPLIKKEIEKCRKVLTISENISEELYGNYGQELEQIVKNLRELFDKLACNFDDGLVLLKEIEQNDIVRQRILLKGYINQSGLQDKWKVLNEMGILRLAQYAEVFTPDTFYRMRD